MSLIEEIGELSLVCASLKAENEELQQLVKDLLALACDEQQSMGEYRRRRVELQLRVKQLIGSEP